MTDEKKMNEVPDEDDEIKMLQKFDDFFDDIGSGWTLLVCRESPKELKSFLEEIPIENPSSIRENIDLGYLARKWGGEVLKLILRSPTGEFRKRILIEMRSYPPMRHGKPISDHEPAERISPMEIFKMVHEMQPPARNQNSELMPILQVLLEKTLNQPQPTAAAPQNGAEQMLGMLTALSKMREFVQPAPEGSQWESVAQEAVKALMPLLADKISNPQPPRAAPKSPVVHMPPTIAAPMRSQIPPQPIAVPPAEVISKNGGEQLGNSDLPDRPAQTIPPDFDLMEIAQNQLSQMSGEDITNLYLAALNDMPENKREAALSRLDKELFDDEETDIPDEQPKDLPASIQRK